MKRRGGRTITGGRFLDTYPCTAFAGIDRGTQSHEACLLDAPGRRHSRSFAHSAAGLADLVAWLTTQVEPACVAVAIEVPHGPVVEALQAACFEVFAINPKQLDRFRDRHSLAGAKDDRLDASSLPMSSAQTCTSSPTFPADTFTSDCARSPASTRT